MLIVNSECDPQMILFFFPQIYCRFWSSHLGYKHTVSWMKHRISCLFSVFWPFFWHSITPNFLTNVEYYGYSIYHWEWQISLCKVRCTNDTIYHYFIKIWHQDIVNYHYFFQKLWPMSDRSYSISWLAKKARHHLTSLKIYSDKNSVGVSNLIWHTFNVSRDIAA